MCVRYNSKANRKLSLNGGGKAPMLEARLIKTKEEGHPYPVKVNMVFALETCQRADCLPDPIATKGFLNSQSELVPW